MQPGDAQRQPFGSSWILKAKHFASRIGVVRAAGTDLEGISRGAIRAGSVALALLCSSAALQSQTTTFQPFPGQSSAGTNPLTQPTLSPGVILLMELEGRFQQEVAAGGGKTFASWFADDGMTLSNGRAPVIGKAAIAASAVWSPKDYQLTWAPQGGQMGPQGDMGFTWGHYNGRSVDKAGDPVVTSGRYMTVWKKLPNGDWKVALESSADDVPAGADCCSLPKP